MTQVRRGMLKTAGFALALLVVGPGQARADTPTAAPARIHVRGAARIDAHSSRSAGKLVLRGTLTDDSGTPLGSDAVTLLLSPVAGSGPSAADAPPQPQGSSPHLCAPVGERSSWLTANSHGAWVVPTDDAGHFCVETAVPTGRYVAHLAWPGSAWLQATADDVPVDLARRPLVLSFAPEPGIVRIDAGLTIEAIAMIDEDGTTEPAPALTLTLRDERGSLLGSATTNAVGRARFAVDAGHLGPAGKGELRVAFDGDTETGQTQHVASIERRTRVVLVAPDAVEGALAPVDMDDVATFVVNARTTRGEIVPTGSVEALVGGAVVGAATIESGVAHLVVGVDRNVGATPDAPARLRIRYASDAPWYTAGDELSLALPVHSSSPWTKAPLVLAGLGVIAWLVIGRSSRERPAPAEDEEEPKPLSHGEAKIEVIRSVRSARVGWTGRIVDAHEGTPVPGARVSVERPSFGGVTIVASASASVAGRFELRCEDVRPGDTLAVEAPLHSALRKPVPPFGELQVAVILRRRRLLDQLVGWARVRGKPYDQRPEPTPGHVRRAAVADPATARWADAVEQAAFGTEVVDDQVEKEVERLAPLPPGRHPR